MSSMPCRSNSPSHTGTLSVLLSLAPNTSGLETMVSNGLQTAPNPRPLSSLGTISSSLPERSNHSEWTRPTSNGITKQHEVSQQLNAQSEPDSTIEIQYSTRASNWSRPTPSRYDAIFMGSWAPGRPLFRPPIMASWLAKGLKWGPQEVEMCADLPCRGGGDPAQLPIYSTTKVSCLSLSPGPCSSPQPPRSACQNATMHRQPSRPHWPDPMPPITSKCSPALTTHRRAPLRVLTNRTPTPQLWGLRPTTDRQVCKSLHALSFAPVQRHPRRRTVRENHTSHTLIPTHTFSLCYHAPPAVPCCCFARVPRREPITVPCEVTGSAGAGWALFFLVAFTVVSHLVSFSSTSWHFAVLGLRARTGRSSPMDEWAQRHLHFAPTL